MGLDKQPKRTSRLGVRTPPKKRDEEKKGFGSPWSQAFKERYLKGLPGPPSGMPIKRGPRGMLTDKPLKGSRINPKDPKSARHEFYPSTYWSKGHEDKYQKGILDSEGRVIPEGLRRKALLERAKRDAELNKKPKRDPNPDRGRKLLPEELRQLELEEARRTTS